MQDDPSLRPMLLHVEVHSLVPPPLAFRPKAFNPSVQDSLLELGPLEQRRGHMVHCSLSAVVELLRPFGYEHMVYHDAIFASKQAMKHLKRFQRDTDLEALWLGGFYCHPLRPANPAEISYQQLFLYDYRRWSDPSSRAEERMEQLQLYLDHWHIQRGSYHLYLGGRTV